MPTKYQIFTWQRMFDRDCSETYVASVGYVPEYKKNTMGFISETIYQNKSWFISNPSLISFYSELAHRYSPSPDCVLIGIDILVSDY